MYISTTIIIATNIIGQKLAMLAYYYSSFNPQTRKVSG